MEFHELLKAHASSLTALRLQGSCKLVICLDLAARNAGIIPTMVSLNGCKNFNDFRLSLTKQFYSHIAQPVLCFFD